MDTYSSDFQLISSKTIENPLPLFGGYFAGSSYNFIVVGQSNPSESTTAEVIRILRYDKSWNYIDSSSIYGSNTYIPFRSGSCRMDEANGILYIHTCHLMFTTVLDGLNHQANMTYSLDEESMTVTQSQYRIFNDSTGYVSHSFNQFIITDGTYIYRLDHGDGYPRSLILTKGAVNKIGGSVTKKYLFDMMGASGNNYTGVSVGGFALAGGHLLTAANSIDQTSLDTFNSSSTRNIFVTSTDTNLQTTKTTWLTNYAEDGTSRTCTPHLVKLSDNKLMVMWEEKVNSQYTTKVTLIDNEGNIIGETITLYARLSECKPFVNSSHKVIWYATSSSTPVFYEIDPDHLENYIIDEPINLSECNITLNQDTCEFNNTYLIPSHKITYGNYTLIQGKDYKVSNNTKYPGEATITFTGTGAFADSIDKTITITPVDITNGEFEVIPDKNTFTYTGSNQYCRGYLYRNGNLVSITNSTWSNYYGIYAGSYTATYTANPTKGYTGQLTYDWTIEPANLADEESFVITVDDSDTGYTGSEIKPKVTVKTVSGTTIPETYTIKNAEGVSETKRNYSISYKDNVELGNASVTITGENNLFGTVTRNFTIVKGTPKLGASSSILYYKIPTEVPTSGDGKLTVTSSDESIVSVSDDGKLIGQMIGSTTITISSEETEHYEAATKELTMNVSRTPLSRLTTCYLPQKEFSYTGSAITPEIAIKAGDYTLVEGTDYTLTYYSNVSAGSNARVYLTGIGNFSSSGNLYFTILPRDMKDGEITLTSTADIIYSGTAKKPSFKYTLDGNTFSSYYYTIDYANNTNAGTATITLTSNSSNFTGSISKDFTIQKATPSISLSKSSIYYQATTKFTSTNNMGITYSMDRDDIVSISDENVVRGIGAGSVNITASIPEQDNYKAFEKDFTITVNKLGFDNVTFVKFTESYPYTGQEIKPAPVLTYNDYTLQENVDFTTKYQNNTNVGQAVVYMYGINNISTTYTGRLYFNIVERDLEDTEITLDKDSFTYDGTEHKPNVTVKVGDSEIASSNYTVTYENNINAGTATVTITGKNNCTGTQTLNYTIKKATPSITVEKDSLEYLTSTSYKVSGDGDITATSDDDSIVTIDQTGTITAKKAGSAKVTIQTSETANYKAASEEFTITVTPINLSKAKISLSQNEFTYNGEANLPKVTVSLNDTELIEDRDYKLTFKDNVNAGTASLTLTGQNNYTGSQNLTFTIKKAASTISLAETTLEYLSSTTYKTSGTGNITVSSDDDSIVSIDKDGNITAKAVGKTNVTISLAEDANYTAVSKEYSITVTSISLKDANLTLSQKEFTYTGSEILPDVTVILNGKTLQKDEDYSLTYEDNIEAGTAKAVITGINNYSGSADAYYTIRKAASQISLDKTSLKYLSSTSYKVTGDGKITATSDDDSIVTIDTEGHITAVGAGTTDITIKVDETANYKGTSEKYTITVSPIDIKDLDISLSQDEFTYTGSALLPDVAVSFGDKVLKKDKDYDLSYKDTINAGTASVTVTCKGNFTGNKKLTYIIHKATPAITLKETSLTYLSSISFEVSGDGKITVSSKDESIAGINANGTITGNGIGETTITINTAETANYEAISKDFTIRVTAFSLEDAKITLNQDKYTYNGSEITPKATVSMKGSNLTEGTDYTVSYKDNIKAGIATMIIEGKGYYGGIRELNYTIGKAASSIELKETSLDYLSSTSFKVTGNGKVTVTSSDDSIIGISEDGSLIANGAGTATVTIFVAEADNYEKASKDYTLTVNPITLEGASILLDQDTFDYTGSEINPNATVTLDGNALVKDKDFRVTYENNINAGNNAMIKINGIGNYKGITSASYTINKVMPKLSIGKTSLAYHEETKISYESADNISFEVVDVSILTVTKDGKVKGIKAGTTDIKVTVQESTNNKPASETFTITVAECTHDYEVTSRKEATCEEKGHITYTCEECGDIKEEDIDASGHNVVTDKALAATASSTGLTEGSHCSLCNKVFVEQKVIPRLQNKSEQALSSQLGYDPETAAAVNDYMNKNNVPLSTVKVTQAAITKKQDDTDFEGSSFGILKASIAKLSKNSVKLKWSKVPNADGYMIYGNKCGKGRPLSYITSLSKNTTTYTQSKLTKGTYYKYLVIAYKNIKGKKVTICVAKTLHGCTLGGKFGVAKSIKITKAGKVKNPKKVTMKKEASLKLTAVEVKGKLKIKKHRNVAFESSNPSIVKISGSKITALKPGKCTIYAYAQNGVCKSITVTVTK